jgi:hypothetical protein
MRDLTEEASRVHGERASGELSRGAAQAASNARSRSQPRPPVVLMTSVTAPGLVTMHDASPMRAFGRALPDRGIMR